MGMPEARALMFEGCDGTAFQPTPADPAYFAEEAMDDMINGRLPFDLAEAETQPANTYFDPAFVDTQDPDASMLETEPDVVDIEEEPLDVDQEHALIAASLRRRNIRTASYTDKEDKVLCESWMTCGQTAK